MVILLGCGGGGGSSSSDNSIISSLDNSSSLKYEGKTTPANLDKETARDLVSFVISSSFNGITSNVSSTNKLSKSLQKQSKLITGRQSGTVDYLTTKIDASTVKIVATFNNYNDTNNSNDKNNSETLTGKVTYMITVDKEDTSLIQKMDMDISLLTLESVVDNLTMDGSIIASLNSSTTRTTFTQNLIIRDNKSNKMIKFENFIMVADEEERILSYQGKVYNSSEGYVVVSTPVEISYEEGNTVPNAGGIILYEGKETIVKERIAYDGRIRIELDNAKDDTVDEVEVYNGETMKAVPNTAPIIELTFPKEIFVNTDLSEVAVKSYDPDLDEFDTVYEWKVNNVVKSNRVSLANGLFKKHDTLELMVTCEDDRVGNKKQSTQSHEQKVLNSRPIITASFEKITATIGETKELTYNISDADNDSINISWKHIWSCI